MGHMTGAPPNSRGPNDPVRQVYSTEQALHAAGITRRRLLDWVERGIISPAAVGKNGSRMVRLYTFHNLVELRAAVWLRQYLSLQMIELLVLKLRQRGSEYPLASLNWAVVEHQGAKRVSDVVVQRADGSWELPSDGQIVMQGVLRLAQLADEVSRRVRHDDRERRKPGAIEKRRGTLGSTPVFAGTRVPVATVQRLAKAGWSERRILENYPTLSPADVRVALVG